MKIRALTSFCGALTMAKNEVLNCDNEVIVQNLLSAGYVEAVESEAESAEESQEGESEGKPAEESQSDESTEVAPAQPKAPKKGVKKSEGK